MGSTMTRSLGQVAVHIVVRDQEAVHKLTFAAVDKCTGVPQCTRCWRFGHVSNAHACPFKTMTCPICRGPHSVDFHRALATCCRGNPKAKVLIPSTLDNEPCPHDAICVNCNGKHRADDRKCKFWAHRFDADWIYRRYSEANVSDSLIKLLASRSPSVGNRASQRVHPQTP